MPRVKILRNLDELPIIKGFRPIWLKANVRQAVIMKLEEYEAIRLIDYEKQNHEQAATAMNVSRPTVTRIYENARLQIATALVEGRSLLIEGGDVIVHKSHWYCEKCSHQFVEDSAQDVKTLLCPQCQSSDLKSLNDCFLGGCRRCRRCR
ncbi:MAG: hypothetical protein CVU48_05480 [Candidatus Cloacimonetes bacterium HGW-Cloacimonetes-1]|jgi:predicted DNA-binding protein (UPF0251 family)|nr:MAG: hypothetical protein CVU48_05480 [Candidatus Cloacimonetes bacterium HGW-Cloacimonetes-1]